MPITRTRTKYYVLSILGALVVALGVLAVAPSAQAQVAGEPSADKECTPNPVQVGEQITCTIDVEAAPDTIFLLRVTDTLPAGLTVTGATSERILVVNGVVTQTFPLQCSVAGNTVTCPQGPGFTQVANLPRPEGGRGVLSLRVTIEARAEQCGTFQNTATATGNVFISGFVAVPIPFTVSDTEQITVEGCEVPPAPEPAPEPGQQQSNQQQGAPAPITQEGEQESEAGEIDQSFDVS